jgi:hypothetical protein
MRAFHATVVPILLFAIYLVGNYFLNSQYDKASVSEFLVDNIKPITWACAGFCLGITFDFARRATHGANCKQIHGDYFLWAITVAVFFQLVLAAGEALMLEGGTARLITVLNGYEVGILMLVFASSTINSIAYGIFVDIKS